MELWAAPLDVTVLSVSLATYRADVFADARFRGSPTFHPGCLQLMQRGVSPRALMGEGWRLLHIYLPQSLLMRVVEEDFNASSAPELLDPIGRRDPALSPLGLSIAREVEGPGPPSALLVDSLGCAVAVNLVRGWSNLDKRSRNQVNNAGQLAPWQIKRAIEWLAGSLSEEIRLADLARETCLSSFYFARAFKASTGVPPHRYLVQLRITKARELLEATNLPIGEIAAQVGYDDPSYLARLFRREVGLAPSAYRQERRR
jgi:AraC family transcriptional regulator